PYPFSFTDHAGNKITITARPSNVVSLVPSVSEIICKVGAADVLKGVTWHSTLPSEIAKKDIIGGFFSPNLSKIESIQPDIIFVAQIQKNVIKRFSDGKQILIDLETDSINDSYDNIMLLGRIFDKEYEAAAIVKKNSDKLKMIAEKIATIPLLKRKRVIRLMGRNSIMTPGDDSFQNEMIRAAGGITPVLGKKGNIVPVTKKEWIAFNPQVIYGCGGDKAAADKFFSLPGWKDVDAVRQKKIYNFPCDLTCRASTNTGYFVSWLSARIYKNEYAETKNLIKPERITGNRSITIELEYIKKAVIAYSDIYDFPNKSLIVDFKNPMKIISTLEGERTGIISVGNHYSPPPCWGIGHDCRLAALRSRIYKAIGKNEATASFLFTGADMDNLAVKMEKFREMQVYALVTAGVRSNAVRMSKDNGNYYEPGTINIIILTNMKLTDRAMTRAIISATEAKTAALLDLDIRSSYNAKEYRATGTGTDNIIVVQGKGTLIDNTGGHTKMGELIAKSTYEGVKEAVYRQNGIVASRNIFQRLKDRKINIFGLMAKSECECNIKKNDLRAEVEKILLNPKYSGFLKAALVISDDYEKGLLSDLTSYKLWAENISLEIAGREIEEYKKFIGDAGMPVVLKIAFNAVINGAFYRIK
ncbi:MAG: adenosylcobinamide amidohydrolase, partial [Deltaproteobacteria bacterium]|nr:adenosylcobinamide amidohydrolase [Deltaproteobacteria bacterium]